MVATNMTTLKIVTDVIIAVENRATVMSAKNGMASTMIAADGIMVGIFELGYFLRSTEETCITAQAAPRTLLYPAMIPYKLQI